MRPLIAAELLKLTRRRAMLAQALALTTGLVALFFAWSGEGGTHSLRNVDFALAFVGSVAGILVGCAAGAGDHSAGVLRELVATGCDRRRLFAARVPALLAVVVPLSLLAVALAGALAALVHGPTPAPSLGLVVRDGLWATLAITFAATLTLGVAAAVGHQAVAVGSVVGLHLTASLMVLDVPAVGAVRHWIPLGALARLEPAPDPELLASPVAVAIVALALWTVAALAAGAWRTATEDL